MRAIELGMQIQSRRYELRWTQQELADKAGTSQSYIHRLENGQANPTLETLEGVVINGLERDLEIDIIPKKTGHHN